jgi:hypothetical protein
VAKRFGTPGEGGNAGYSEEEARDWRDCLDDPPDQARTLEQRVITQSPPPAPAPKEPSYFFAEYPQRRSFLRHVFDALFSASIHGVVGGALGYVGGGALCVIAASMPGSGHSYGHTPVDDIGAWCKVIGCGCAVVFALYDIAKTIEDPNRHYYPTSAYSPAPPSDPSDDEDTGDRR